MGLVSRLCVAFLLVSFVTCQAVEEPQRKPKQVREKGQRMSKFRKLVKPLQEDISELQETVQSISNPVHVHVHGISNDGDKVVENWAVDQHGREVQDTNPAPPRAGGEHLLDGMSKHEDRPLHGSRLLHGGLSIDRDRSLHVSSNGEARSLRDGLSTNGDHSLHDDHKASSSFITNTEKSKTLGQYNNVRNNDLQNSNVQIEKGVQAKDYVLSSTDSKLSRHKRWIWWKSTPRSINRSQRLSRDRTRNQQRWSRDQSRNQQRWPLNQSRNQQRNSPSYQNIYPYNSWSQSRNRYGFGNWFNARRNIGTPSSGVYFGNRFGGIPSYRNSHNQQHKGYSTNNKNMAQWNSNKRTNVDLTSDKQTAQDTSQEQNNRDTTSNENTVQDNSPGQNDRDRASNENTAQDNSPEHNDRDTTSNENTAQDNSHEHNDRDTTSGENTAQENSHEQNNVDLTNDEDKSQGNSPNQNDAVMVPSGNSGSYRYVSRNNPQQNNVVSNSYAKRRSFRDSDSSDQYNRWGFLDSDSSDEDFWRRVRARRQRQRQRRSADNDGIETDDEYLDDEKMWRFPVLLRKIRSAEEGAPNDGEAASNEPRQRLKSQDVVENLGGLIEYGTRSKITGLSPDSKLSRAKRWSRWRGNKWSRNRSRNQSANQSRDSDRYAYNTVQNSQNWYGNGYGRSAYNSWQSPYYNWYGYGNGYNPYQNTWRPRSGGYYGNTYWETPTYRSNNRQQNYGGDYSGGNTFQDNSYEQNGVGSTGNDNTNNNYNPQQNYVDSRSEENRVAFRDSSDEENRWGIRDSDSDSSDEDFWRRVRARQQRQRSDSDSSD